MSAQPAGPFIEFRDVSKAFGENRVLDHVSFDVLPGETVCILGRSGVGKSVSLHHIMGFLKPDSGRIFVAGEDITDYPEQELQRIRKKVTMVFQNGALFDSLTVYDNVSFALTRHTHLSKAEIDDIVEEKLALVGLPGTQSLMPSQLSGGMQKRVGLARAIAMSPEVLLYDEPTSGLDPVMTTVIDNLVMEMRDKLGVTSVVVSHALASIFRISDRIAMLHQGTIIACGTADEIRSSTDERVQQFVSGRSEGPIRPGEIE